MTTITTVTGREINLAYFGAIDVDLHEIAKGLSQIRRFNGQTEVGYNVAAHSMHVCDIVKREGGTLSAQLAALHHDAHEYLMGDITTPFKEFVNLISLNALAVIEAQLQRRVLEALMVRTAYVSNRKLIHRADMMALGAERRDLQPASTEPWPCQAGIAPDWEDVRTRAKISDKAWAAMYVARDLELRAQMQAKADAWAEVHA